ncbi:MAG: flagellin lysine-N-methylase [Lachnospiraceae bacterium]|nr:flagellin lysine-N-methylase [Lachnospiraceae bacterium]
MLYMIPDYYKEFQCIAEECEDTCCAGWKIVVDARALKNYRSVRSIYRKKLKKSINWRKKEFRQGEERRCAFLREDNLCDMYTNLGRDSLCRTCRLYPRHVEEFEGVREITLSISCPEAARILLHKKEPVHFLTARRKGEEEYEDFDLFLYSQLVDAREVLIKILQNRELSIAVRMKLMLGIARDMQLRVNSSELFACEAVLEKYQKDAVCQYVKRDLAHTKTEEAYRFAEELLSMLESLEFLKEDWCVHLCETQERLYGNHDSQKWNRTTQEFFQWLSGSGMDWEIQKEQLLVYFISTYFCGAVYDGEIYGKAWLAAVSVLALEEMLKARWLRNEKMLDQEEIVEIVYRYSREIEHSDINLEKIQSQARLELYFR